MLVAAKLELEFVDLVVMEGEYVDWHVEKLLEGWRNWDANQTLERVTVGKGDYKDGRLQIHSNNLTVENSSIAITIMTNVIKTGLE